VSASTASAKARGCPADTRPAHRPLNRCHCVERRHGHEPMKPPPSQIFNSVVDNLTIPV